MVVKPGHAPGQPPRQYQLKLVLHSFLLTVLTGLLLAASVWFFSSWAVRGQLAAWTGNVVPPAVAPESALPVVRQPAAASLPAVRLVPTAGQDADQPVTHVALPPLAESSSLLVPTPEAEPARQEVLYPQGKLIIDRLKIDEVARKVAVVGLSWDLSSLWDRVGWLETTGTNPDDDLAMVFIAHVTLPPFGGPGPFLYLSELKPGDLIFYKTDEETFVYMVDHAELVSPDEVQQLYRPGRGRLLLVTCASWNPGQASYDSRLLVEAKLIAREKRDPPPG